MASSNTYLGANLFDASKSLPSKFLQNPAFSAFADAVTEVLDRNVEQLRRKLAITRDTYQYRKDQVISNVYYDGGPLTDESGEALTNADGSAFSLPTDTRIPAAKIIEVIQNNVPGDLPSVTAVVAEFTLSGNRTVQWTFGTDVLQERSILVQNANMLGFNFFNTNLTDEDFQRLNEFISMYWPEGGEQNYVNFMSFVKDIRLEAVPLWSYDDGTDTYPILEPFDPSTMVPVYEGGKYYMTSHVQLQYDPIRDAEATNSNTLNPSLYQGVEQLFYFFAPILLVLERVCAAIDMAFDFFVACSGQELYIYQNKVAYTYGEFVTLPFLAASGQQLTIEMSRFPYVWPLLQSQCYVGTSYQAQHLEYGVFNYDTPLIVIEYGIDLQINYDDIKYGSLAYQIPVIRGQATNNGIITWMWLDAQKWTYEAPSLDAEYAPITSGQQQSLYYAPTYIIDTDKFFFTSPIIVPPQSQQVSMEYANVTGVYTGPDAIYYNGIAFPELVQSYFTVGGVITSDTLIYVTNIDTDVPLLSIDVAPVVAGEITAIFQAKVSYGSL